MLMCASSAGQPDFLLQEVVIIPKESIDTIRTNTEILVKFLINAVFWKAEIGPK